MLRGGEDIGLVFVISPEFHEKYERETWACYYHAEASMNGQEVQLQGKLEDTAPETPKNSKLSKEAEATAKEAPKGKRKSNPRAVKKGAKATLVKPDASGDEKSEEAAEGTSDLEKQRNFLHGFV